MENSDLGQGASKKKGKCLSPSGRTIRAREGTGDSAHGSSIKSAVSIPLVHRNTHPWKELKSTEQARPELHKNHQAYGSNLIS